MVTETRVVTKTVDAHTFVEVSEFPGVVFPFGSTLTVNNVVEKEKTAWNFRRLIARGDNATSFLFGYQRRYTTVPHFGDGRQFWSPLKRAVLKDSLDEILVKRHFTDSPNVERFTRSFGHFRVEGLDGLVHPSDSKVRAEVDSLALGEYSKHVINKQRHFQALVAGGEIRETIELIRSPGRALRGLLNGHVGGFLKKGAPRRFHSLGSLSRYVSDKWLEFAFGVKPLVADVEDGARALSDILNRTDPNIKASGFSASIVSDRIPTQPFTHFNLKFDHKYAEIRMGYYVKYFGCLYCPTWSEGFPFSGLGLTWSDILPTIYELIPYSFLIDYFTNLGAIIEGFSFGSANLKWSSRQAICVYEISYPREFVIEPDFDNQTVVRSINRSLGDRVYFQYRDVLRHNYYGSIIPDLRFSLPGPLQWLNIAALLGASRRVHSVLRKGI